MPNTNFQMFAVLDRTGLLRIVFVPLRKQVDIFLRKHQLFSAPECRKLLFRYRIVLPKSASIFALFHTMNILRNPCIHTHLDLHLQEAALSLPNFQPVRLREDAD